MQHTLIKSLRATALGLCLALGLDSSMASAQTFKVFACEPEWAALVRELAPHAQVMSATHARQDPHYIEARPSLISALRQADLAVCTGAELEAGWLPMLQQRSGNARVQNGRPGMFYAADAVELIDPREKGGLFDGDVHPRGNPHLHLDPYRLLLVAQQLSARLQELQPDLKVTHQQRLEQFESNWRSHITRWEQKAKPLEGLRVVVQHTTYGYLWRWLKMNPIADLEPLPGMPPTPGHLQRLLTQTRTQPPAAVIVSSYQDVRPADWLAQQLGGSVVVLQMPSTVSDDAVAPDLVNLFDHLIERLLSAAR